MCLYIIPTSCAGLFCRAIAQSGCALNPWAFNETSAACRRGFRFGEALGCATNDSKELVEFLRTVPTQQLVEDIAKAVIDEVKE
jgi:carboxylesterase type B